MKRTLALLLSVLIFISGCGNSTKTVDLTKPNDSESKSSLEDVQEETEQKKHLLDKDVDIILSMYFFDDTDINDFVEQQKTDDPDGIYAVYDDTHYTCTIKESKRKELVEKFKDEDFINDIFKDVFTGEQYNGAFLSMDYDDMFRNVTFYVDKNAYDNVDFDIVLGPLFISGFFADSAQAYNLISPDDRNWTVKIIDNDTNETLFNSDEDLLENE